MNKLKSSYNKGKILFQHLFFWLFIVLITTGCQQDFELLHIQENVADGMILYLTPKGEDELIYTVTSSDSLFRIDQTMNSCLIYDMSGFLDW